MKKIFLFLFCFIYFTAHAQENYWQQQVNYIIDVSLNDTEHTLDGFEKIEYMNNSPDTLQFIWFHLWPNAYRSDKTAFSEQLLDLDRTDFYFSGKEDRGYINRLDFKVDGSPAKIVDHPRHIDIIKLLLPKPLPPHQTITISTPFHVKLPFNFSRGGHVKQAYQVTQWYPKPAVYDRKGWHPMPYLHQGEFYSEFGNFDVRITIPENYVVAATGELQNADERKWLSEKSRMPQQQERANPLSKKKQSSGGKTTTKPRDKQRTDFPVSSSQTKSLRYLQEKVHDFAWFADKRFIVSYDTMQLLSGRVIDVFSYNLPSGQGNWKNSISFIKDAVHSRSAWLGEYPYQVVSAVEAPIGFEGGMEYPTITSISPLDSEDDVDQITAHEISHNWLYGILANNERSHPWMDEGMNTYYDNRYKLLKRNLPVHVKTDPKSMDAFRRNPDPGIFEGIAFETYAAIKKDQPINTASENLTMENYFLVAYYKTGQWMKKLEDYLGKELFDSCMHEYYRRWQFKHPYPEDFKQLMESVSGKNLDLFFVALDRKGSLEPVVPKKSIQLAPVFKLNETRDKHYILLAPAIGANLHDGFMIGAVLHNYQLPLPRFNFVVAPLYATGSKKWNGLARASYSWYPDKNVYRVDLGAAAAKFSMNDFQPAQKEKMYPGFRKLAPFIRVTFKEKSPLSRQERYVQFKSFFINEDKLEFRQLIQGTDTSNVVNLVSQSRNLNQLKFVVQNTRVLYPYKGEIQLEQHKDFLRAAITGRYFLNYPNGKSGLNVRFFAGKFIYSGSKTSVKQFETDRYHLNLTGPNGYEDYTYSDYFVGRNKFEGWGSQQIMLRDGGFKVRTDLLSSKVGKTDNWLLALNVSSDIPKEINPLQVLPVKIPVKVFADLGTSAETWGKNAATGKFLFDMGFQISLFQETINIYIPVIYSTVFRDYFRSTLGEKRFWKTISFNIDMNNFSLKKIDRSIPL